MKPEKQYIKKLVVYGFFFICCLLAGIKIHSSILFYLVTLAFFLPVLYNFYAIVSPDNYFIRRQRLMFEPEKRYTVTLTDNEVIVTHTDGSKPETVRWDDLQLVEIVTTDEGPYMPDLFYVLYGKGSGCAVPVGANNFDAFFVRLQQLKGFNNAAAILAASSVVNDRFELWSRRKK